MKVLKYEDIFNRDTVNIFTDASIMKIGNDTLGCPGAVIVEMDENNNLIVTNCSSFIIDHSTNNDSEIRAIHLGVQHALGFMNRYKTINLFSDSNICIQGLRDWIFGWVNCINGNVMYGSSGYPVANQAVFLNIINTIVNSNLRINLYHQKGHVIINSEKSLMKAKNSMIRSNKLDDIDMNLVIQLSVYNDMVDVLTKDALKEYSHNYTYEERLKSVFISADIRHTTKKIDKYGRLIGGRK